MGYYTGINILNGSHLGFNAVQRKLNSQIPSFNSVLLEELDFAMMIDFPRMGGEWPLDCLYHMLDADKYL